MKTNPQIMALIFMKGYSERVPGKNLRVLNGKPLFHWIMDALVMAKSIDEIIINTDSDEIAKSATGNYDVTIHMRPEYLLDIHHNEANQIIEHDLSVSDGEYFLQTHSTNPLLTAQSIDKAIDLYFSNKEKYNSLMSVTKVYKRFYTPTGVPVNHDPNNMCKTQDMMPLYEENSSLYIFSRNSFAKNSNRVSSKPLFYSIDSHEAVDIDDEIDFEIVESLMNNRQIK
jgi:CMP-N-acetylneuraminic acid synthetase